MSNNQVLLKDSDGSLHLTSEVSGLTIIFFGKNSRVVIGRGSTFSHASIKLDSNSSVEIEKTSPRGIHHTTINMQGSPNSSLIIGNGISIESSYFGMANESAIDVVIGSDCMFSTNICFRPTDGHAVYDLMTKTLLNATKPIIIGNHVWFGAGVTILKGAVVPNDSIVATSAVVTRKFKEKNIIIAGNPATIVKNRINWDRRFIDKYRGDETNNNGFVRVPFADKEKLELIQYIGYVIYKVISFPFLTKRKKEKLINNPIAFFQDSKQPITRAFGKVFGVI